MTDEELKAINEFQYLKENDIITPETIKNKDIVMDLISKLQRELEELKDDKPKPPTMMWEPGIKLNKNYWDWNNSSWNYSDVTVRYTGGDNR